MQEQNRDYIDYKHISYPLRPSDRTKRVKSITTRLIVSNVHGKAYFTDIFLQTGTTNTGIVGNVSEFKWTLNG